LIGAVDSPVSRISQSAASQIRVDHDQDRAAHHPVEGLDQVRLALRLGQRRPPGRSGLRWTERCAHCFLEGDLGGRAGRQLHRLATHDDLLGPAVGAAES
jgi:hypothetical protein